MLKEEAIRKHRDMWNYIADEIENEQYAMNIAVLKAIYLVRVGDANDDLKHHANCYLCHYTNFKCDDCPLKWPSDSSVAKCEFGFKNEHGMSTAGLYKQCYELGYSEYWEKQAKIAREIANLPERKMSNEKH